MKKNRTMEYVLVIIINVVFAIYTNFLLNGIPYISLQIVTKITYLAVACWFLYGCFLYMVLKRDSIHIEGIFKHILRACVVGILTSFSKAVLDYLTSLLMADRFSFITNAVVNGIIYNAFGIGLIAILFTVFVKGKRQWSERSGKPFKWIMVDVAVYLIGLFRIFFESTRILKQIGTSEENIWKTDYYYAHAVLPLNLRAYIFLMIFFWWLMRTLYSNEEDDQLISEGK